MSGRWVMTVTRGEVEPPRVRVSPDVARLTEALNAGLPRLWPGVMNVPFGAGREARRAEKARRR